MIQLFQILIMQILYTVVFIRMYLLIFNVIMLGCCLTLNLFSTAIPVLLCDRMALSGFTDRSCVHLFDLGGCGEFMLEKSDPTWSSIPNCPHSESNFHFFPPQGYRNFGVWALVKNERKWEVTSNFLYCGAFTVQVCVFLCHVLVCVTTQQNVSLFN